MTNGSNKKSSKKPVIPPIPVITAHQLYAIASIVVFIAGATWGVSDNINVKPRDFIIQQQTNQISDLTDKLKEQNSTIIEQDSVIKKQKIDIENLEDRIRNITKVIINITTPKEGDKVPGYSVVRGTISGELPEGQYIWVVSNIVSVPGLWWPQAEVKPQYGLWQADVWLGSDKDVGTDFSIAIILLNENDNKIFMNYREEGNKTGNFLAIKLPDSAIIMDSIKVTRIKDMNS